MSVLFKHTDLESIDLWAEILPQVQLGMAPSNQFLGQIMISGLPEGVAIVRAVVMVKYRLVENTNAAENYLDGDQNIEAMLTPEGELTLALTLLDQIIRVPASTREAGDVLMGTEDISSQITGNGDVLAIQWTQSLAAQDSLNFQDVQAGLRIWFKG